MKRRWGILARPLEVKFDRVNLLVRVIMKLHNLCIRRLKERHGAVGIERLQTLFDADCPSAELVDGNCPDAGFPPAPNEFSPGYQSQIEASSVSRRIRLMNALMSRGFVRPSRFLPEGEPSS